MDAYDKISKNLKNFDKNLLKKLWVKYTTGYDTGVFEAEEARAAYLKDEKITTHSRTV